MATRPRRGKYLPIPVPRPEEEEEETNESDSESSSSAEVVVGVEEELSESSVENVTVTDLEVVNMGGQVVEEEAERKRQAQQGQDTGDMDVDLELLEVEDESDKNNEGDSFVGTNLDDDDFLLPPTPRAIRKNNTDRRIENIKDSQEIGKVYEELIDTCHKMEADSGLFDEHFADVMTKNIETGCALFQRLVDESKHISAKGGPGAKRRFGGPGDMYLAFLHTKVSSNVLRSKAERIGSGASIFSTDVFIESLKREYVDEDKNYDSKMAAGDIAMEIANGTNVLMPLVAVVGTYDRDAVALPPKSKKPRVLVRRTNADEQQEMEGDPAESNMQIVPQNPGSENLAKEIKALLKQETRKSPSVNLFEFVLDKTSFSKTIENMFNLSFLVQKGHVSVTKEENGKFKDLSLAIKPEKSTGLETSSPDEGEVSRNQIIRQKCIISINSLTFKQMIRISQGENVIPSYPTPEVVNQQEHQSHSKRGN